MPACTVTKRHSNAICVRNVISKSVRWNFIWIEPTVWRIRMESNGRMRMKIVATMMGWKWFTNAMNAKRNSRASPVWINTSKTMSVEHDSDVPSVRGIFPSNINIWSTWTRTAISCYSRASSVGGNSPKNRAWLHTRTDTGKDKNLHAQNVRSPSRWRAAWIDTCGSIRK